MNPIKNYSLLAGAMLTLAFTACSNDEIETVPYEGPVAAQVIAGIDGAVTRASDTSWGYGDAIGITCSGTNTYYTNMKYVTKNADGNFTHYNGDTEETKSGIFFQGKEEMTFSAYYPFTGPEGSLPGADGKISGSTASQYPYTVRNNIDYLFAKGAKTTYASPTISFNGDDTKFKHKMVRLRLALKTSTDDGFDKLTEVTLGTYTLGGLRHAGTFNVKDGKAEATSTSTVVNDWSVSSNCVYNDLGDGARTYIIILYPQEVNGALPFTATIKGQEYKNTTDIKFENDKLVAGTSYTFTITMKKTGMTVSSCTIDGWGNGTGGSGDATIQ